MRPMVPKSLTDQDLSPTVKAPLWHRLLPFGLLVCLSLAAFFYGRAQGWDLETVADHRAWLLAQVRDHPLLTGLGFFGVYLLCIILSLPVGSLLSIVAGFLFGTWIASLWVVAGATLGSIFFFQLARGALRETLAARAGPWLTRLERGFKQHAVSYLLVARLLPILPFWVQNLVPALLGVPFGTFVVASIAGLYPWALVFCSLGGALGTLMDRGEHPDLGTLLDPVVLLPLIGLSILALLPVAWRRWKRARVA